MVSQPAAGQTRVVLDPDTPVQPQLARDDDGLVITVNPYQVTPAGLIVLCDLLGVPISSVGEPHRQGDPPTEDSD